MHAARLRLSALILNYGSEVQRRGVTFDISADITLQVSQVQRVCLGEPHVPIETRAFIKPAVAETCVHASHKIILAAIVRKIRNVKPERRIAIVIAAKEISVKENECVTKRAVEVEHEAPATIAFRNFKRPAIPANTGLGILPP